MAITTDQSYASVAEADAYASARGWTDWAAASTAAKEAALLESTAYLDATYRWPGSLADIAQVLGWPRADAYDREGRTLTGTPAAVVSAAIEAARLALTAPLIGGSADAAVTREKVGPLEVEYQQTAAWVLRDQRLAWVASLLRSISGIGSGTSIRLMRA